MKNLTSGLCLTLSAAAWVLSGGLASANGTFITFDGGFVTGINSANTVTGYNATKYTSDGFVRTADGVLTTFAVPQTDLTEPESINGKGTIAGSAHVPHPERLHGFVRAADGTITTFDGAPQATVTWALSINNKGQITGEADVGRAGHGFVRNAAGKITNFDAPGADETKAISINDKGVIAGIYYLAGIAHGFVRVPDGTITTFDVPGSSGTMWIGGINIAGSVTGYYDNGDGTGRHGFVRTPDGTITIFDGPNCSISPTGINRKGVIAGYCSEYAAKYTYVVGFFRSVDGTIETFSVPDQHGNTWAGGINDSGVIAGAYKSGPHNSGGFLRFP